ncbi:MAG: pseudoazurin [Pseudomonadota bacterium]
MFIRVLALTILLTTPAFAETHYVKMLNEGENGKMVYEPDFLRIEPDDKVKFLATDPSHNAYLIKEFMPAGAEHFKGGIDEEIEVTLTVPGHYGIKCSPHYSMGMVMIITVGDAPLSDVELPPGIPRRSLERFEAILTSGH